MFRARLSWLLVVCFSVGLLFTGTQSVDAKRSCKRKRRRCLYKCARKSRRNAKRCRRKSLRQRRRCIRIAHRAGRKCVKKSSCPQAEECYKKCNQTASPVACFAKKGCANQRAACYASCQIPIGQTLKQCLDNTKAALDGCKKSASDYQVSCQNSCPTCS